MITQLNQHSLNKDNDEPKVVFDARIILMQIMCRCSMMQFIPHTRCTQETIFWDISDVSRFADICDVKSQ